MTGRKKRITALAAAMVILVTVQGIAAYQSAFDTAENIICVPYTTINARYNEAIAYWNSVSNSTGASNLDEANFNKNELDYCMNDNMKIKIFGSDDFENMVHGFSISSDGSFDVSTTVVEIYAIVYAMDLDVESPVKVQDLVGNILDEASYKDGGIKFINTSIEGKKLSIMGLYNAD